MYANKWFDRCGFSYANESFLSWLIDYEGVREADYIADTYNDIVSFDREKFFLEYGEKATVEAEEEIKEDTAKIMETFGEYCKSNSDAKTFEEEMQLLMKWYKDFSRHTFF